MAGIFSSTSSDQDTVFLGGEEKVESVPDLKKGTDPPRPGILEGTQTNRRGTGRRRTGLPGEATGRGGTGGRRLGGSGVGRDRYGRRVTRTGRVEVPTRTKVQDRRGTDGSDGSEGTEVVRDRTRYSNFQTLVLARH